MRTLVGYRNESFQGSGITNPISVAMWERRELRNTDIQDTLHDRKLIKHATFKEAIVYLRKMYKAGYTKCVWVCPSIRLVKENYTYEGEPLTHVDKYTFSDYIIVSTLGDSHLVIYRTAQKKTTRVKK
jgi:hypothetical protein